MTVTASAAPPPRRRPRLSVRLRYAPGAQVLELARRADELGLHGAWVSEPWGFDAGPVLGAIAAQTRQVVLGTHVASVFARTPAATAGLAGSLATLAGEGRFRLGLGTSGPQVVEGWHGVEFAQPLARTRDTIAVVRQALAGQPVAVTGQAVTVPHPGAGGRSLRFSQLGEPLDVPVYLGALGPANQRLTAEVADGWTPTPYSPDAHAACAGGLDEALVGNGRRALVQLAPVCPVALGPDTSALRALERPWSALYLGGMGPPERSFYAAAARRMGHGAMVDRIATAWTAHDRRGAAAAVTDEYVDAIGLFGPPERVRERFERYAAAGVDEVVVELRKPDPEDQLADLRALHEALGR